jgi:hypothetical protein
MLNSKYYFISYFIFMKKSYIIIIAVGVVGFLCLISIGIIAAVIISRSDDDNDSDLENAIEELQDSSDTYKGLELSIKACDLLDAESAREILKSDVERDEAITDNSCTYTTKSEDFSNFGVLSVAITKDYSDSNAEDTFKELITDSYDSKGEDVSLDGVDDAFWAEELSQLALLKGSEIVFVSGSSIQYEDTKLLITETAKKMIENWD